jgi:carbonic anhydrase
MDLRKLSKKFSLVAILTTTAIFANGAVHWGYEGKGAPENWGSLTPEFRMCKDGVNQSPINLTGFVEADLPKLEYKYDTNSTEVLNNGHAVQVNVAPGSKITIDGIDFELKQFHFHTPSENNINGKSFPLEAHFVHASKDGKLAVVALMFKEGKENPVLAKAWDKMPMKVGDKNPVEINDIDKLLPENRDYYRFNGSLTTPPCTEGVRWIVIKEPVEVSKEQVEKFAKVMGHPNNRPVQPLNARIIAQ